MYLKMRPDGRPAHPARLYWWLNGLPLAPDPFRHVKEGIRADPTPDRLGQGKRRGRQPLSRGRYQFTGMSTLKRRREDNPLFVMKSSATESHSEWGYYRPPTTMWPKRAVRNHIRPAIEGVNMDERKLKVLISEERLQARIQELGKEIRKHYGDECITCIGVLKGSFMFGRLGTRYRRRCAVIPGRFIVSRRNQIYGVVRLRRSSKSH